MSIKWDLRFLELARLIASWSKDTSTKVGSVAVGSHREILSVGYNGFPRGVNDDKPERYQRPLKYNVTEHSERNLIYNACRTGISLVGSTIYCTHFPCTDCARAIIQSGIREICYSDFVLDNSFRKRTYENQLIALEMLKEAGVICRILKVDDSWVSDDDLKPIE